MKKILVVVDTQNDFISGNLGFDKAEQVIDNIVEKVKAYEQKGYEIVFTQDTHNMNYSNTREGKNLPVLHCIKGSLGWKISDKLQPFTKNAKLFEKETFGSLELMEYLKDGNYDEIELVGIVTNICVISNAILALTALPNAKVIVDSSCVGGGDKQLHDMALEVMKSLHVIVI